MPYPNLMVETEDGIATVTVNRPEKRNALDRETFLSLETCFEELAGDTDARAVVVTGAGDRAFVAGADISAIAELDARAGQQWCALGQRVFNRIERMRKPVIAAINGYALGAGLELAMACHLRVADERARLGQPEVKIGWIPGNGGSQRLPRLVGLGKALEMMLTGEPVSAEEARWFGLVNAVVPAGKALERARELAARILENSSLAVATVLEAVYHGREMPFADALAYEAVLGGITAASPDAREGARAFLEKRKPRFGG